jgi:hypothetical protein
MERIIESYDEFRNSEPVLEFKSDADEYEYLVTTKPKYTYKQILPNNGLKKAMAETGAEEIISALTGEPGVSNLNSKNLKKVKDEFLKALDNPNFTNKFSKYWNNYKDVKMNLFHTLVYYHHAK